METKHGGATRLLQRVNKHSRNQNMDGNGRYHWTHAEADARNKNLFLFITERETSSRKSWRRARVWFLFSGSFYIVWRRRNKTKATRRMCRQEAESSFNTILIIVSTLRSREMKIQQKKKPEL